MNTTYPKPLLKWVGGKTQLLHTIMPRFPVLFHNYHELFLGGGSVLLAVLYSKQQGTINITGDIYAYDTNISLIGMYKNIQQRPIELYEDALILEKQYYACDNNPDINRNPSNLYEAMQSKENYYYWIRKQYNECVDKQSVISSAMFIFLNKTCFRGLYRVGPNGFNVPFGNYTNPTILDKHHLQEIHELIQSVKFIICDFSVSITNIGKNDFAYLDPPYVPETSKSFVKYTEGGFLSEQHELLFSLLHNSEFSFILSNSNVELVKKHFDNNNKYIYEPVLCKRTINSKKPNSKAEEVIIQYISKPM